MFQELPLGVKKFTSVLLKVRLEPLVQRKNNGLGHLKVKWSLRRLEGSVSKPGTSDGRILRKTI